MKTENVYRELEKFYSSYNPDKERMTALAEKLYGKMGDKSGLVFKTEVIDMISRKAKIHLFRQLPFFFEFSCGRARYSWGGHRTSVARILADKNADIWLNAYEREMWYYYDNGYVHGWNNPVGFDNHCPGYDMLLEKGLCGIIEDIQKVRKCEKDEEKLEFYSCMINSLTALGRLALRFSNKALECMRKSKDEELRSHYGKIADAARNVPIKPAASFYEALCCIVFCREAIGSLDGLGIATYGQIDRLLEPYYEKDITNGNITPEEARELIRALLIYTEVRFNIKNEFHETSTTMVLGGCDADGNMVFNDVTRFVLQCVLEERTIGTKINCRISKEHPEEYIDLIASVQAANIPTIVVQNDETHIGARVKHGQDIRDARLYVSGGCHETVLANTEVNTRADTELNTVKVLLDTMKKGEFADFDAFYREYLSDFARFYTDVCNIKNKYETMWKTYAPHPLFSSTITGCLESGKDISEGGAKYSNTSLSNAGTATLVDSLYSIKKLVFEQKKLTLAQLLQVLEDNFEKNAELRRYIVNDIPKYGTSNEEVDDFSAMVLADFAKNLPKLKNARGGRYMPAFYPHSLFLEFGKLTSATPDGRLAGTPLSRGCSPSEFIEVDSPLDIFYSMSKIDFTDYTDSFCCELTLPRMENQKTGRNVIGSLIKMFIEVKGSTLQMNTLDREILLAAQKEPELHKDVLVRICGYSERFVTLCEAQQEEVISRTIR